MEIVKIESLTSFIDDHNMNQSKSNFFQNGSTKKMEVSFKATVRFSDDDMNGKKIEINPKINLHNPNIMNINVTNNNKGRLAKIPEINQKNNYSNYDREHEDTERENIE